MSCCNKVLVRWSAAALVAVACGCSETPQRAAPVDPAEAKATLARTLDAWKAGGKPEELAATQPPVTVQDMDWSAGARLLGYELLDEKDDNANLLCRVKITLDGNAEKPLEKTVTYIVGTSPSRTVFREWFQ
jgi:hypothetical protein